MSSRSTWRRWARFSPGVHRGCTKHPNHLRIFLARDNAAIPDDVDLGSTGGTVAPHLSDLLHPAGVMPGGAVLLAQDLEQLVQPLVDLLERLAEFPSAVGAVLGVRGHGCNIPTARLQRYPNQHQLIPIRT